VFWKYAPEWPHTQTPILQSSNRYHQQTRVPGSDYACTMQAKLRVAVGADTETGGADLLPDADVCSNHYSEQGFRDTEPDIATS